MEKRIPRPFGVTSLLIEYNKTGKPELLDKVRSMIIHEWILKKNQLGGIPMNLYEISNFLEVNPEYVNKYLVDNLLSSRIWNKDSQEEIMNAVIGQSISWVLEDRLDIQNQVDILKASQGGEYKPFISAEVTKAIALKLSSSNTLQSVIKGLSGSSINIFNQQNNETTNIGYSQEEAMELIQSALKDKNPLTLIEEAEYELIGLGELPEVIATKQTGVNLDKEGISINKPELTQAIDNYKGNLEEADKTHHEMRREIELNIDPDEKDPETDIYPG